jgi:hypothetical protein
VEEIFFIAVFSVIGKLTEDCRKIGLSRNRFVRLKNVNGLYEAFNLHLVISLAVFALLVSRLTDKQYLWCLIVILFAGVTAKGVFSYHKPERLSWSDYDARWGLIVPNGFAFASIMIGIYVTSILSTKTSFFNHCFVEAIIVSLLSVSVGILLSAALVWFGVKLLSSKVDDKEKLRAYSVGVIDVLLEKGGRTELSNHERQQLRSSLMTYFMTAVSQRTAKNYLKQLKKTSKVLLMEPDLYTETESIYKERFPGS